LATYNQSLLVIIPRSFDHFTTISSKFHREFIEMGYNTANTKWPTSVAIPDSDKSRIDTFFNLLDTDSPEVGDRLADEIFVEDGILSGPAGGVRGEGMSFRKTQPLDLLCCRL
jgi:hypothetical protein